MYLKKIEILGFKSFASKTVIQFSNGITAIVGPNGCGKTNILDALRWVLGEQKVSLLRGGKMEEVIFNGTRDAKPLGMAEVTLTLVNNRGILPTEYNEVQITRRLFRSGESEYLLNKVPCRLKDITELFYDTGVGAHSYSVIQQEMVEAVISDKAEERRFLFEEAAGITKYKQRKKAALRKLEATENDFLRLNDIYAEVQTQVRSLKRQYRKAERYQKVADGIQRWELYLSSTRIKAIDKEMQELGAAHDSLTDRLAEKEAFLDRVSSRLESERKEQIDSEHELTRVGNEIYQVSEKAHSLEREISVLKEKKSNAATLIERNQNDITALKRRSELLAEQDEETLEALEAQERKLEEIKSELKEAESVQAETDLKLLAARGTKEQGNQKLIELEGRLSSGRTEEDSLRQQEQELSQTLDAVTSRIEENGLSREKLRADLAEQKRVFGDLGASKTDAEASQSELTSRLEQLIEKNEELTLEVSDLNASIEACRARKNLLEDMILHYEGYESGVKAAMEIRHRWPGIAGTVAEKFVPVEGLESAVEAALGEMARFLICDSRNTAEDIISYLKSENKGRVGILVPDSGTLNPVVKRPELDMPEFVGWLDGFIVADDALKPLMQAVLARTAVFKSGFEPDEILTHLPYGFVAVSTGGELYTKNVIAGGSDDGLSLFRRKEKVTEQDTMIDELGSRLSAVQEAKNKVTADMAAVRAELEHLSGRIESLTEELAGAQNKLNEIEYQHRTVEAEINRLEKEKKGLTDKLESIRHRQYTLKLDSSELTDLRKNLVNSMDQSVEQLYGYESAAAAALERMSSLQVRLVEQKSKIEQTESKSSHLKELEREILNTIEAKTAEIESAREETESSAGRINALEADLKLAFGQRRDVTNRQNSLRASQNEVLERVTEKERQLKEARSDRERINEEIHQLEIKLNTLESEVRSICDKVTDEFAVDIRTAEVSSPDESMTEKQARDRMHQQKELLKRFGAVNLLAIDEYRTASERERFLGEQLDDLAAAKKDLETTITRINQTAKQLFNETFEKVRLNFRNLFVELFTGGEADIVLSDPADPLESDIHIIARPEGKKLLSITMMSGGERALTAISLLFSLYLVKPSPFCILDEIDAPLDDANCHRFLKIIRNFSERTQFVTITHNKITMEAAHNLYGVTMEQLGISKLVAVKFADAEQAEGAGSMLVGTDMPDEEPEPAEPLRQAGLPGETVDSPATVDEVPSSVVERLSRTVTTSTGDQSDQG